MRLEPRGEARADRRAARLAAQLINLGTWGRKTPIDERALVAPFDRLDQPADAKPAGRYQATPADAEARVLGKLMRLFPEK